MSVKYFNKEKNEWVIFPGTIGAPGEDSYQIAVNHGYKGTYEEYQHMIAIMPDVLMKATDFVNNIDEIPTENSDQLVKSGGVYSSIKNVETLVNDKSSELNSKIEEAKSEIENNINPKLDELNDRITDVESDLNGSLDDLEKIVIDNKNDSDNSISDLEKSFDDKMQEVLDNLNNKANVSDIPTDYVTPDVIEGVYSAIDNIDTTVSAEEVATVLDADMIAGVVNGSLKIEGTAITDGAIATRHMIANTISGTVITGGTIIGDKIAANTLTSNHIKGSALNGLTIEDGAGKWKLNKDGSGYLASQNIKWDTSGNVTFGSSVTIAWSDEQTSLVNNAQSTADSAKTAANKAQTDANTANSELTTTNAAVKALQTRMSSAETNIANKISASEVVDALTDDTDSKAAIAGLLNGSNLIEGTAIKKGAIGTEQIAANYVYAGEVAANKISAGTFDADVVYAGTIKASQITSGKITADQIDSTNLHVKAANIDGKLTADQIDASSIKVDFANVTGTLEASRITGTIEGLTIQSGDAWVLNADGSGHVANGNLSWDASGNVAGTGAFTGSMYEIDSTKESMINTENPTSTYSHGTADLPHRIGLFNSIDKNMFSCDGEYVTPLHTLLFINSESTREGTDQHEGTTYIYDLTNIILLSYNITYSGNNMKLKPYEFKIVNKGTEPIYVKRQQKDSNGNLMWNSGKPVYITLGTIPVNAYSNMFMYTDENDTVQCYFQS